MFELENLEEYEKKEKKISMLNAFFMITVIICYLLRDSFSVHLPVVIFYIIYTLGFITIKRDELVAFFAFLVPLSSGPLLYFLNVIFAFMLIIKCRDYIKIGRPIKLAGLIIIWETLHFIPNSVMGYNDSIIKLLAFSLCLLSITIVISNSNISKNYISILLSWCIGFASFCSILLIKYINSFGVSNFTSVVRRFGWIPSEINTSSTSLLINPNALGKLVILTVFLLLTIMKYNRKHTIKLTIIIIYFLSFGLMSASRTFLIVYSIVSVIYLLEIIFNIRNNKKMLLVLISIVILTFLVATNYLDSVTDLISKRFAEEDISGSRFNIYRLYLETLRNSPYLIFGSGMQDYNTKYSIAMSSHNFFVEVISIWGLVGIFIVIFWFVSLFKSLSKKYMRVAFSRSILHYLPLLGLFLYGQTGQFFISYYSTLPTLILAFLNIKYVFHKRYISDQS